MDEPLSNLDAKLREEARAWLRELIVRLGLSALVVTHDQTEAMAMSDKILLLNFGRSSSRARRRTCTTGRRRSSRAEFMGSNNPLPGTIAEVARTRAARGRRLPSVGNARAARSPSATRPRESSASSGCASRRPGENRIPAELVTAMFMGDRSEHLFKLGALRLRGYGATPARRRTAISSCRRTISGCLPRRAEAAGTRRIGVGAGRPD
jgi:iron(III) transport system ATP-binding protein